MSILITGKNGTIGSNLDGIGFSSSEYDLRKSGSMTDVILKNPDTQMIIHCAASVGGLDEHLRFKKRLFHDNMLINLNVLEESRLCGVNRIISFLSSCIYSDDAQQPYNENNIHVGEPFSDYYPYGFAKRMLEIQSRIYYEEYGLIYNCLIPTNVYGINDNFNIKTGHVIAVLIHKCFLAKRDNTSFNVWGDGKQEREFLFTGDVKSIVDWAVNNYYEKAPLVLSNNQPVNLAFVAELIAKAMNFKGKILFESDKPSGQKIRSLSGNKLLSLMDIEFTSIESGVNTTVEWFLHNYDIGRR
jgi:GDP-L-fucose synthase